MILRRRGSLVLAVLVLALGLQIHTPVESGTPVQHIVVVFQENHSFDNALGKLCVKATKGMIDRSPCEGTRKGTLSDGSTLTLARAADLIPSTAHNVEAQRIAINGGAMDGFDRLRGCRDRTNFACYSQFYPSQIPNLATLAEGFTIADHVFELRASPSWGGHIAIAAAGLDGFSGDNPTPSTYTSTTGPGWGCDSYRDSPWSADGATYNLEPSCIPDQGGNGPYRDSPVVYLPTLFDRLGDAGETWKIYGGGGSADTSDPSGYQWTICPTFYECLNSQLDNFVPAAQVVTDAGAGTLPSYSIVTPTVPNSQHNEVSMLAGDNWIGQVVSAIENGPQWDSTAIFVTYDDCGCFYDHVAPPKRRWGVRVPLVIVSPYAKAGYTDSGIATYSSILAYVEHTFGLSPVNTSDSKAYDFANSFDYTQRPLPPLSMVNSPVPPWEPRWIAEHPIGDDPT